MYRKLFAWFVLLLTMIVIMQWQGGSLVTHLSSDGILNLEFAHRLHRLRELKSVWTDNNVYTNIFLDFIFIFVYTRFFMECSRFISIHTGWVRTARSFGFLAVTAGILDVLENICMLLGWSLLSETALVCAWYLAAAKFMLIFIVVLFILFSFGSIVFKRQHLKGIP